MASGSPLLGGDLHTSELSAPSSPSSRVASGLAKPFIGRPVLLKNAHSHYIRSTPSGVLGHTQNTGDDASSVWKFEAAPNGSDDYVCISNYVHDLRLSALDDCKTIATSSNRTGLETFRVLPGLDGRFVFETTHHTHLSQDESGVLSQSTSSPSSWQQFDVFVKPNAAVSRHPSQGKLDVSVSLIPLDISTAGTGAPGEVTAASPKASTSTAKKQSLISKIGNFLSPGGRNKKPSIMMGDSSADINDPSLQPITAAGNDSKSREASVVRKYSLSQSQGGGTGTASPSPQHSPPLGPSTPPRRSSLSQGAGGPILLLTPPEGTSSTNISPITVTLQPASSNPTTSSNATPAATATGTAPSINLLSPLPSSAAAGGHRYTPSTSGLSFTQLPPGYQRQQNEDGWGMSLYTPRGGAGHLSVPSMGGPPGHQSTPSATWGNSITVAQMEMFVRETSHAQELQRGHIRDESLFLPPASPSQSGHSNPQTFASTGSDPVLAAKLKERTAQVTSLKKQISDLEDTIVQGKQLLANAQAKEAAHEKHIAELRASWQQEWHENEAKLKEEYELREIAREKASSDERIAMLNAQLIIVHDEKVREERGHLAEQAERRRLEKEVDTLNWDIKNLEDALKRERERVKLRPNEQSLKDWNELLNSLLKQERDTVSDLKQADAVHRSAEEDLKRFTSLLMFKQKELQVQGDRVARDTATLDARRAIIESDGVAKFKASDEGKRLLALAEQEERRLAEEAAAIERAKAEAAEREKQAQAAAAAASASNAGHTTNNGNNNRSNRSGSIFSCWPGRNNNSKQTHKQAAQTPSTQAMT